MTRPGPAAAQGIDCTKARSPVEKTICASPALVTLDRAVGQGYAAALARQPDRHDALRSEQLAWIRARDTACALPTRAIPACLNGQLTTRLAALAPPGAPPGASPAAQSVPTQTGVTHIDAPVAPVPDPVIPSVALPNGAATLDQASVPAAEQAETLLHVTVAGRFILTAKGPGGAALQLVDMLTGPGVVARNAGSQDGRLDSLLDVGVYKLRVFSAKGASGTVALSVTPFHPAAVPAALPQPGQPLSATLHDGEQRAFWLTVPPDGLVRIEAAGRALADLRLWRDGRELSGLDPAVTSTEPTPGHPLANIRLVGKVEPGTYLAVAYGGPAATWTDGDAAQPFHLRAGASDALALGWVGGPMGPFGSEIYALPASTALLRLALPQAAPATLSAGAAAAFIAKNSREPTASLSVVPGRQPVMEVRAAAGQRFTLRAMDQPPGQTWVEPGTWWVSAVANGAGGDEVPPSVLLERNDHSTRPARIVAESLPQIGPNAGWRARFNLRGPTTILARSGGGPVALRTEGVPVRGGQLQDNVPQGVYALTLTPEQGALGAVEVVLGPPGATPPLSPPLPADPVLPLGVQAVSAGETLQLSGGTGPGVTLGLAARAVPVALAEGPLAVTVAAGAGISVPVRLAPGGTLSVTEIGSGAVPYTVADSSGQATIGLPPADHARTVVLAWRRIPVSPTAIPAPPPAGAEQAVQAGTPVFFDLQPDQPRSFALTVGQGGLYRIETLGRLRTMGQLATPFLPHLGTATANGVGQNMLISTMLRAGRYRVQIAAQESAGRAGLSAMPAPLLPAADLRPGGSVRATLPAGSGTAIPIVMDAAATVHLDVASLGADWQGRLEDAGGWPITVPGKLDGIERALPAGRYRVVIDPAPVTRQVVVRLRTVTKPVPVVGHGPHPLPFDQPQSAVWREPDSQQAPRTPDQWQFKLEGSANVALTLDKAMVGTLRQAGVEGPSRRVNTMFTGLLPAGDYTLDVTSLGRNDRASYTVALGSKELQPGTPRKVDLPATLPFAIAAPRVVSVTSFGTTPVKAVLKNAAGHVLQRLVGRTDDWNIALSRPLPAGTYMLELSAAAAPDSSDITQQDGPATADSSDDSSSDNTDSDTPTIADDQVAQTAASQAGDAKPAKPDTSGASTDDDAAAPQVEVRLSLPQALDPQLAPAAAAVLAGRGVHVLNLASPPVDTLLVAQAESAAELAMTLERRAADGWQVVGTSQGRAPMVASPADGAAGAWRVQVWSLDEAADPVRFAARAVALPAQAPGQVTLSVLADMPAAVRAARVQMPAGLARVGEGAEITAGGWPGQALIPAADRVLPVQGDLWLLGPDATGEATPLLPTPGQAVPLTVPAGLAAMLPDGGPMQLWIARGDRASLGGGMGYADGSSIALAHPAVALRDAAGDADLRADLRRVDLRAAPDEMVQTALHIILPPGGALPLRLPAGSKQIDLQLAPGTGAMPGWHTPALAVWAGDAPLSRSIKGDWTELLLVNPGDAPAPVTLALAPAPTVAVLAAGQVSKRFFGAAGSFETLVQGGPGARLHLTGPGRLTLIDGAGLVSTGQDLPLGGPGRAVVSHRIGAVALWVEAPGASPWPEAAAQPTEMPSRTALSGSAMAFALHPETPVLLHVNTTSPVLLGLQQAGRTDPPTPFPAGAAIDRVLAAGSAALRLYPPQDGDLTGTVALQAESILPVGEGLGPEVTVAPGGAAAFGFNLVKAATIGVGLRATPDRITARLLNDGGAVVGRGIAQLIALPAGHYVLEAQVPPGAPVTVLRPAVVGITPRGDGPPQDVVQTYLELAGMKPEGAKP